MTPKSQNLGTLQRHPLLGEVKLLSPATIYVQNSQGTVRGWFFLIFAQQSDKRASELTEISKDRCTTPRVIRQKNMVMSPAGPQTKNDC
jgi:hypothetical protein